LNIAVFTRSTPDTAAKVEVGADGRVNWGEAELVVNPWDEYALEEAIVQSRNTGGKAIVLAIGGEMHSSALKHGLAMGLDEAIRIDDPALDPADALGYASAAAAAVRKLDGVQLVICGREAVDTGTDQHTFALARKLGWTMLSGVSKIVALDAGSITVERELEEGRQTVRAALPAVITVTKEINEPRFPSFIGIRKASKAAIPTWSLADLGVSAAPAGVRVTSFRNLPARNVTLELIAGTPEEMARTLVDRLIEEKVL
jgi:electron transfer flavoprotein beta subunit